MLLSKIVLRRFNKDTESSEGSCFVILVIAVLVAALVIHLFTWVKPPKPLPLLTQTNGLVQLVDLEDIQSYTDTAVLTPEETFGAELYVIGVYTELNDALPKETVALVYTRDGWRFVEIDFKPITLEEQLAIAIGHSPSEVVLTQEITGIFTTLDDKPRCIESGSEELPSKCEIGLQLMFAWGDYVVVISTDGTHATEGEVIEIARSILGQSKNEQRF
jgi:hypothetical protein